MTKKRRNEKKSQRELQREQQRIQEAYQIQRELEAQKKVRQWSRGKIFIGVFLVALVIVTYGTWQYFTQLPLTINNPSSTPTLSATLPPTPTHSCPS